MDQQDAGDETQTEKNNKNNRDCFCVYDLGNHARSAISLAVESAYSFIDLQYVNLREKGGEGL